MALVSVGILFASPWAADPPLSQWLFVCANVWGMLCLTQIATPIKIERLHNEARSKRR